MNVNISKVFFAVVVAVLFTNVSAHASKTDERIEAAANQSYVFKTYLKNDTIRTEVKDGAVTLTGNVSEESHKALAQETVANLPGVKSVDNKLELKGEHPAENSDGWISMQVKYSLLYNRYVSGLNTQVSVTEGIVTLRGEAESQAQKDLTGEYAKDIKGVKGINNEMTVAKVMTSPKQTMGEKIDDASIKLLDGRWATEFQSLRGREEDLISTIKFSRDGQYVVAYSYKGNAMTWRIADGELVPAEAIPNITDLMDVSPDPQLSATPRGNDIQLIRRNPDYDPWAEDAERRRRLSEKWHSDGATAAEASQNWFAAAFHLGWLLRNQSGDTDLKTRYTESVAKLKKQNMTPPRLPPAAEPLAEEK